MVKLSVAAAVAVGLALVAGEARAAKPEQVLNHHLVRPARIGPEQTAGGRVLLTPWRDTDDVVEGWDWSLPPGVRPVERSGLIFPRSEKRSFPGNKLLNVAVFWRDVEPQEGRYDFAPIRRKLENLPEGFVGCRFYLYCTVAYRLSRGRRDTVAPGWLAKHNIPVIDMTSMEGRFQLFSYPIWDERYHKRVGPRVQGQRAQAGVGRRRAGRLPRRARLSRRHGPGDEARLRAGHGAALRVRRELPLRAGQPVAGPRRRRSGLPADRRDVPPDRRGPGVRRRERGVRAALDRAVRAAGDPSIPLPPVHDPRAPDAAELPVDVPVVGGHGPVVDGLREPCARPAGHRLARRVLLPAGEHRAGLLRGEERQDGADPQLRAMAHPARPRRIPHGAGRQGGPARDDVDGARRPQVRLDRPPHRSRRRQQPNGLRARRPIPPRRPARRGDQGDLPRRRPRAMVAGLHAARRGEGPQDRRLPRHRQGLHRHLPPGRRVLCRQGRGLRLPPGGRGRGRHVLIRPRDQAARQFGKVFADPIEHFRKLVEHI